MLYVRVAHRRGPGRHRRHVHDGRGASRATSTAAPRPSCSARTRRRSSATGRALYDHDAARFGGQGIEVRAISAIDVALWDILGQAAGKPIYQLLGGASRDRRADLQHLRRPGLRPAAVRGPRPARARSRTCRAGTTSPRRSPHELLEEGITAMKFWPFDDIGIAQPGPVHHAAELEQGLEPVRRIREAVGSRMRIMIEGHGFWRLPAAIKIARALEEYDIEWLEDMLLAHDIGAIAELHARDDGPDPRQRVPRHAPPVPAAARSSAPPTSSCSTRPGPAGSPSRTRSARSPTRSGCR